MPTTRKRPTLQNVLDDFLAGHDIHVRRTGKDWTYTNSQDTFGTRIAAYQGALSHLAIVFAIYRQAYTDSLLDEGTSQ